MNTSRFKTRREIEDYLKSLWNLPISEGSLDLKFLVNKKIEKNGKVKKCIRLILEDTYPRVIVEGNLTWGLVGTKVQLLNPLTNKEEPISLDFLRKNLYYISSKEFKSLYYKTEEYQEKMESILFSKYGVNYRKQWQKAIQKTLKERYNTHSFLSRGEHYKKIEEVMVSKYGVKVPIQNEEIKSRISSTIESLYGTKWFLSRGEHYKKIEDLLREKYSVTNVFYSEELQEEYKVKKLNMTNG